MRFREPLKPGGQGSGNEQRKAGRMALPFSVERVRSPSLSFPGRADRAGRTQGEAGSRARELLKA